MEITQHSYGNFSDVVITPSIKALRISFFVEIILINKYLLLVSVEAA